ncbi:hypothetical protein FIE12Z_10903 [Fusarium flagelliforme]|uniref:Uncharacterized protein n=1 Tax=Fusarium flagelliforme TaxID=2675880 RepID=A0A395MAA4_9HYPO|nr:hypothetical protein FIE12Z_10903 [Fusarium flagelliforme]
MSERSNKRKVDSLDTVPLTSTEKRRKAAEGIAQFGFKVIPCSRCSKRGVACKMIAGKKKCGLCVSLGRPCNVTGTPLNSLTHIINKAKRLEEREAAAEELLSSRREALRVAQRELDESLSQLETCRKRKKELVSRGVEMTRRGLDSLDELEEAEKAESSKEQLVVEDINSLVHSDVLDFSFFDFSGVNGSSSGVAGH